MPLKCDSQEHGDTGWTCSLPLYHSREHEAYGYHRIVPEEFCASWPNTSNVSDDEVAAAIASIQSVCR